MSGCARRRNAKRRMTAMLASHVFYVGVTCLAALA
jgi:hypothetical protein